MSLSVPDKQAANSPVGERGLCTTTGAGDVSAGDDRHKQGAAPGPEHIVVCICTYKRPQLLKRLLDELSQQEIEGQFTCSVVVADNDASRSAEQVASEFARESGMAVKYCVEPRQGISLARNKAVEAATGDFIAFIDDDEFPSKRWLHTLLKTCTEYRVDGVLGPVKEHFDEQPPMWIVKGDFFQRPTYPTGTVLDWMNTRTGNVLLRTDLFDGVAEPFRPKFRSGEDQDFFRRMINKGRVFIWCNEAPVYEIVPPSRWKRTYLLKKALLFGSMSAVHDSFAPHEVLKSVIAVPAYMAALPFAFMLGQHRFMTLFVKLCHHLGKLLSLAGIKPIADMYVSG
jgi:succinoglycan biosynthesis protein ExoM